LRLTTHSFKDIKTFVTYHPSALLRNPNWKKPAWQDLQRFQAEYIKLLQ
ncbi:MAG: uracil-DNA glycosylase, partial [Candidatus Cloacimonetes bacterium]|nr:uracil-DNA glycosylase [Candidatus Cloacimonadota bacterium]